MTDRELNEKIATLLGDDFGEKPEHSWKLDEDGEIDDYAMEYDPHAGPACTRCNTSYCRMCSDRNGIKDVPPTCVKRVNDYVKLWMFTRRIINKLVAAGWTYMLTENSEGAICEFFTLANAMARYTGTDKEPTRATCLAALQLAEEGKWPS